MRAGSVWRRGKSDKDLQLAYLLAWLECAQVPRKFLLELGPGQSSECRRKFGGRAAMSPPASLACIPFELFYCCVCQYKELLSSFRDFVLLLVFNPNGLGLS